MKILSLVILAFGALSVSAATVHSCDGLDSIGNMVGYFKEFEQHAVRVARISTEEPVAASEHLLIFLPEEPMGVTCYAVSADQDAGFEMIDFARLTATYSTEKGLLMEVPVKINNERRGEPDLSTLKVLVNRRGGNSVTIQP